MTNEAGLEFDKPHKVMPSKSKLLEIAKALLKSKQLANDKGYDRLSRECEEAWNTIMEMI